MASIQLSDRTDTTLTVYLDYLDNRYNQDLRTCKWYIGGQYRGSMTLPNQIVFSENWQFTSLSPDTEYEIKAIVSAEAIPTPVEVVGVFRTKKKPIAPFKWSSSATTAFTSKGATTKLTANEWNSLIDKVEEVFPGWNGNSARVDPGDPITARIFNKVYEKVGGDPVQPGYICYGRYFIDLVLKLNNNL